MRPAGKRRGSRKDLMRRALLSEPAQLVWSGPKSPPGEKNIIFLKMQCAAFTLIFQGKNARESTPPTDFISFQLIYSSQLNFLGDTHLNSFLTELTFSTIQIFYVLLEQKEISLLPKVSISLNHMELLIFYHLWP